VFGVRKGGIAVGNWSPRVPLSIQAAVAGQAQLMREGKLQNIPTTL
jgi:hypothetical protein